MLSDPVCLRVKGPFACFTRPEFHVERVSYPIITPSAARGVLEAILMKPIEKPEVAKRPNKIGFRWHILRLGIIRRGTFLSILRNELGYESHPAYGNSHGFDIMDKRTQRHNLILKDVEYLIEAVIAVDARPRRPSEPFLLAKYHQMFLRRARAGQCYYQPFLGCREFSVAAWDLMTHVPDKIPDIPEIEDLGVIFRDFDFSPVWRHWSSDVDETRSSNGWSDPGNRPKMLPPLYAKAERGWIRVNKIQDGKVIPVL